MPGPGEYRGRTPSYRDEGEGDWREHKLLILQGIDDLKKNGEKTQEKLNSLQSDMSGIKVKVALFGAICGGAAAAILELAVTLLKGH